jgi:hypothetical protein
MKKILYVFSIAILLGSCSPKFTDITDYGFGGGGMKVNQIKRANKNESELNLSLESKRDKVLINSELTHTGLLDSIELISVQSNHKKQEIKPNKTVAKLNKIFYPLMPKSVKEKFEKTIKSKSNIFGYEGDNDGMTIGFNILMYGLFALLLGMAIFGVGILIYLFYMPPVLEIFIGVLVILGLFLTIIGGLIFLVSWIVS